MYCVDVVGVHEGMSSLSTPSSPITLSSDTSSLADVHRPANNSDMFAFLRDRPEDHNNTSLFDLGM